ncbi:hypothetical protein [Curtobacterium sp. 20TX0008]|uniref:hypothetical protein n=1 Tax=Curtobacterium sp. 20TX0008 TaxID=3022018 RepID=UPI00232B4401|nr:hypothetical protein [Curtobacterium sp. 20TX0008]MDB6428637.1 hypothetical protein [Curtobacterium sp. 20TX0008]
METDDQEQTEEAPPGWVLRTPTRYREVLGSPVLALVLAVVAVLVGRTFGDALALVTGTVAGVLGIPIAATIGIVGGFSQISRYARSVPRFDLSAVAWAFLGVVLSCAVLVVLGLVLPEGPVLPAWRAAVWVGGGIAAAVFAAVLALVHAQRAGRAPSR